MAQKMLTLKLNIEAKLLYIKEIPSGKNTITLRVEGRIDRKTFWIPSKKSARGTWTGDTESIQKRRKSIFNNRASLKLGCLGRNELPCNV